MPRQPPDFRGRPCKSCGEIIIWIVTPQRQWMPINATPTMVDLPDGGTFSGYESHFATCPQADEHRRR